MVTGRYLHAVGQNIVRLCNCERTVMGRTSICSKSNHVNVFQKEMPEYGIDCQHKGYGTSTRPWLRADVADFHCIEAVAS